jgi:hypothetical protein
MFGDFYKRESSPRPWRIRVCLMSSPSRGVFIAPWRIPEMVLDPWKAREQSDEQVSKDLVPYSDLIIEFIRFIRRKIFGIKKDYRLDVSFKERAHFPEVKHRHEFFHMLNFCNRFHEFDRATLLLLRRNKEVDESLESPPYGYGFRNGERVIGSWRKDWILFFESEHNVLN